MSPRRRGSSGLAVVVSVLALVLAGCGSDGPDDDDSSKSSGDDYKVLLVVPTSGAAAATGAAFVAATKAAVDLVNSDGGMDGHTMTLKVVDDGGDPTIGVPALQAELASGTKYDLIVPGVQGTVTAALLPLLKDNPALQMSTASAVNDPKEYPRFFSVSPGVVPTIASVLDEAKAVGYTHLGVMAIDNAASKVILETYESAGAEAGVDIDTVAVAPDVAEATPQWQQLIDKGVDAVVLTSFDGATASASLIKGMVKLGSTPPVIADNIFGSNPLAGAGITDEDVASVDLQATKFTVSGTPEATSDQMKAALEALKKYQGNDSVLPIAVTTIQMLAVLQAADAANAAGSTDGAAVAKELEEIDIDDMPHSYGPSDPFSADNHSQQFTSEDFTFFPMTLDVDENGFKVPGA